MRPVVARVALDPLLISLFRFLQFPGHDLVIGSRNGQLFPLAGVLAQLKRLVEVLAGPPELTKAEIVGADRLVPAGKIRIKLDGALVMREGCGGAFLAPRCFGKGGRVLDRESGVEGKRG